MRTQAQAKLDVGRTLKMALSVVLSVSMAAIGTAQTVQKAVVKPQSTMQVDSRVLALLRRVQSQMHSIQTLSVVCTHTLRRRKTLPQSNTSVLVQTRRIRLMRPNYTRID